MSFSLAQIATHLDARIVGDPSLQLTGLTALEEAAAGDLSFLSRPKYEKQALTSKASALIVGKEISGLSTSFLVVDNPYFAFAKALALFHPEPARKAGIHESAVVAPDVVIGEGVTIEALVRIESGVSIADGVHIRSGVFIGAESKIGKDTLLHPNVTIREGVKLGARVIVHSGTVIGSDGFGFAFHEGRYQKIPQVGGVLIEDDVEIGANVAIDRATLGMTIIGAGSKLDNLVQVAHNVKVGSNTVLVSQVGISGSSTIGSYATLAGQVGVAGHLKIGDRVTVGGKSGITKDIADGETVSGFPPVPHKAWLKSQAAIRQLPAMRLELKTAIIQIKKLEKQITELIKENESAS